MKSNVHLLMSLTVLAMVPFMVLSGCASKKYVDQQDSILRSAIEANSSAIAVAENRVVSVEGMADTNAASIAALQEDVAALDGMRNRLAELEDIENRVAELEGIGTRMDDVEAAVSDLRSYLKDIRVVNRVILDKEVLFGLDNWTLSDAARVVLDGLAADVARSGYDWIIVLGYADALGSMKYNHLLGLIRAHSVATYLVEKAGLDRRKIIVTSYGEGLPAFPNETEEGRAKNRRVEVVVYRAFLTSTGKMMSLAAPPPDQR